MIRDLDLTVRQLLETRAPSGSGSAGADVVFDLPDADWRAGLGRLTVDCYLYDLRENAELRTEEPLLQRSADGTPLACGRRPDRLQLLHHGVEHRDGRAGPARGASRAQPGRPDPARESDDSRGRPAGVARDPDPAVSRSSRQRTGSGTAGLLGRARPTRKLKPSLNYVVTLAMLLDDDLPESELAPVVQRVEVEGRHLAELA